MIATSSDVYRRQPVTSIYSTLKKSVSAATITTAASSTDRTRAALPPPRRLRLRFLGMSTHTPFCLPRSLFSFLQKRKEAKEKTLRKTPFCL